jgi:chromosome segregation ATPase
LGKTGRVINKLVSDNEALKRDIKIERLRADEAKQTARLLEDKMDRMSSDYEGRLLEANVTKTLLARKERQVESLQAAVELERHKASSALERERMWKDEMEKVRAEAKQKVEEAGNYAALMEGRYNAISSHWREQGEEVMKAMGTMKSEVDQLLEERRRDDEKISTLREVCDQQDGNIKELTRQKEEIVAKFEAYKAEQEEALREIKAQARRREEEQEKVIGESREVLDKLKWALGVKENVKWAE